MSLRSKEFSSDFSLRSNPFKINIIEFPLWRPFVVHLNGAIIEFHEFEMTERKGNHLKYVLNEKEKEPVKEHPCWEDVIGKLSNPIHYLDGDYVVHKNEDPNLFYTKDSMYLTKSFFTFGLVETSPGECHVYQTHKESILFFVPKADSRIPLQGCPFATPQWMKKIQVYQEFDVYLLYAGSKYLVKENSLYLILTVKKTLFAVDKVQAAKVDPLDFKDPKGAYFGTISFRSQAFY